MDAHVEHLVENMFCTCGACQHKGAYHTQECTSHHAKVLLESPPLRGRIKEILQCLLLQALWSHPRYGKSMTLMRNGTCKLMDTQGGCLLFRTLTECLNDDDT